jgi:hypothetical protein
MRNSPDRRSVRRLRLITLAVYALTVGWASVAHAASEVPLAAQGIESEHSDQCPTLHADAVCRLAFHVQLPAQVHGGGPPAAAESPMPRGEEVPAFGPSTSPTLARAPPTR